MFGTPSLGRIQQLLQSQGSGFLLLVAIEGGIEITQLKSNLLQSMTDFVISWRPLWWLHNIKSKAGATDMTDMEGVEDSLGLGVKYLAEEAKKFSCPYNHWITGL